jgi:hypothetical protein
MPADVFASSGVHPRSRRITSFRAAFVHGDALAAHEIAGG